MRNSEVSNETLAVLGLRLCVGMNFFWHGAIRFLTGYQDFAQGVAGGFEETFLPAAIVLPMAYAIPAAEVLLGAAILLGAFSRWAVLATFVLMSCLIFGKTIQQDWSTVGTQMIYVACLFLLLFYHQHNRFTLGQALGRNA